jgi:hypothetical protein
MRNLLIFLCFIVCSQSFAASSDSSSTIKLKESTTTIAAYRVLISKTDVNVPVNYKTNSLALAVAHLRSISIDPNIFGSIEILVAGGLYTNDYAVVDDEVLKLPLSIHAYDSADRPQFIRDPVSQTTPTFLAIRPSLNLLPVTVDGLRIGKYNSAISVAPTGGSVYQGTKIIHGIRIENCEFNEIGNKYGQASTPAFSAVGLTNAQDSLVANNTFSNIENATDAGLLHAIYVAHHSSRNIIENNTFSTSSGDVVRIRNRSNGTIVRNNKFVQPLRIQDINAVSFWYDYSDTIAANLECPSIDNSVLFNELINIDGAHDETINVLPQPACTTPTTNSFTNQYNVDITNGVCKIASVAGCPFYGFLPQSWNTDYRSQAGHGDSGACGLRVSAYYGSCTAPGRNGNEIDIMSSRMTTPARTPLWYDAKYGNACAVRAQNCPRMGLADHTDSIDRDDFQGSSTVCLGRAQAWYSSCSRNYADHPNNENETHYVRMRFHSGNSYQTKVMGNGCVVNASFCPRMGFDGDGYLLDTLGSDLSSCQSRVTAWYSSCTRTLSPEDKAKVNITSTFYDKGRALATRSYP